MSLPATLSAESTPFRQHASTALPTRLPWPVLGASLLVHALVLATPVAGGDAGAGTRIDEGAPAVRVALTQHVAYTQPQAPGASSPARQRGADNSNARTLAADTATAATQPQPPEIAAGDSSPEATAASAAPAGGAPGAVASDDQAGSTPAPPAVRAVSELQLLCPHLATPPYPPLARRHGETGRVVLEVRIDEAGRVANVRVVESSGHTRLDKAATAAIRALHCSAPSRDGIAESAIALQAFDFNLE